MTLPLVVERRHTPAKPPLHLYHNVATAMCKCCGRRTERTKGSTKGGRFVCFTCAGGK